MKAQIYKNIKVLFLVCFTFFVTVTALAQRNYSVLTEDGETIISGSLTDQVKVENSAINFYEGTSVTHTFPLSDVLKITFVESSGPFSVTFDSRGGSSVESQTIESGGTAVLPAIYPTKADSSFGGWYSDVNLTQRFNFNSTVINRNYTLYARWVRTGMMYVQGGTFTMGYDGVDLSGSSPETPVSPAHQVTVSDFIIGIYEVSNAEFVAFLNAKSVQANGILDGEVMFSIFDPNGYYFNNGHWELKADVWGVRPAVSVTWYGARAFCEWIGGRLPTEAEWEFAARGGNKTQNYTYIGGENPDLLGWHVYSDPWPQGWVQDMGQKTPNELGLYDMAGNVFEFCWDGANTYTTDPQINPMGPDNFPEVTYPWGRIIRGGGVSSGTETFVPYYRNFNGTRESWYTIGLRLLIP